MRNHLETALELLKLSEELDRLTNPRHTDHDRHVFLPRKIADRVVAARREIEAALDALGYGVVWGLQSHFCSSSRKARVTAASNGELPML